MKVTKLHIDEYKVFKDFDIDFTDSEGKPQNLIVLAGINGTGKTTLLEFILSIIDTRMYGIPSNNQGPLGVTDSYIEIANSSEINFSPTRIRYADDKVVQFFYNSEIPQKGSFLSENRIYFLGVRKLDYLKDSDSSYPDSALGGDYLTGFGHLSSGFELSNENDNSDEQIISMYIDKCILEDNLRSGEAYQRLQNFIESITRTLDLAFKFERLDRNRTPYFVNRQYKELRLQDLSSGERQILYLVLRLFVAEIRDSIILIDEPEFSLHPSWQNRIVGVLQKYADEYNCQVILATHSPHIIGSVKPEQLRLLYKDESGSIKVKENVRESYGVPFDQVLTEVMGVEHLRTPDVDDKLNKLRDLIKLNEYESDNFKNLMKEIESIISYSDKDLILMRFEIAKRKKESAAIK